MNQENGLKKILSLPVIVVALGYMVDMYDLFLFNIVRVQSLKDLGVSEDNLLGEGLFILNVQMVGLVLGGLISGILADKYGRLSVLFGSILIYSLSNIANGFITTTEQYAALRFIGGLGLAGELGAGITLVAEILPKAVRGYGTTLVAVVGLPGAIAAYFVANVFDWRTSYIVGGVLGLVLLVMRLKVLESSVFSNMKAKGGVRRGDLGLLFGSGKRVWKYLTSILIGFPIWFVVGILITLSFEFGKALGIAEPIDPGKTVMLAFTGQVVGNLICGILSQYLRSRKKAIGIFILTSFVFVLIYLYVPLGSAGSFYTVCFFLGMCNGYWALFITVAAELFGTNLRGTVATTAPNFVRASIIPLSFLFRELRPSLQTINAALVTGAVAFVIALIALWSLEETFDKEMDYVEE